MQNAKRSILIIRLIVVLIVTMLFISSISVVSATDSLPSGHSGWSGWIDTKEATCTEDGERSNTCKYCGLVVTSVIKAFGHDIAVEEKKATCTHEGSVIKVCSRGDFDEIETILALGHFWGPWEVIEQPSENKEGLEVKVCLNDESHIEQRNIEALNPNGQEPPAPEEELLTPDKTDPEASSLTKKSDQPIILSNPVDANFQKQKPKNSIVSENVKKEIEKIYTEMLEKTSKLPTSKDFFLGLLLSTTILAGISVLYPKSISSLFKVFKK
ncbi:MAG: hypothetical protein ACRCUS_03785 [Anaerovoracaceae bacterium]